MSNTIIVGLTYQPEFITPIEEQALLVQINAEPWLSDLKQRVQHYGVSVQLQTPNGQPRRIPQPPPILACHHSGATPDVHNDS